MKRIITAVAVIFLMAATSFSQTTTTAKKIDNDKWLDSFEALTTRLEAVNADSVTSDSIAQWRSERANFRREYRTLYKDSLSDSQDQRYFSLTAKYNKSLTKFRLNDAGTQLSGVSDKAKEIGSAVKDKAVNIKDKAVDITDNVKDKAGEVGDKASEIAGSVKDTAKKVGNKLTGWFKGLKGK